MIFRTFGFFGILFAILFAILFTILFTMIFDDPKVLRKIERKHKYRADRNRRKRRLRSARGELQMSAG